MHWNEIVTTVLLGLGCVVSLTGSLGLIRMPDFYTRLHTAGKTDSLGQFLILIGLAFVTPDVLAPASRSSPDVGMILMIAAPTATHAITKAAHLARPAPVDPERPRR
jgi:multicomponent Na+:H+ antiporter subunit G